MATDTGQLGSSSSTLYSLNRLALMAAAEAVQTGDKSALIHMGITDDIADRIKNLDLDSLTRGRNFRAPFVNLQFNPRVLSLFLSHVSAQSDQDKQIEEAIRLGMRQPTLTKLCGITRREYDAKRASLGLGHHSNGRIGALDEDEELEVFRVWKSFNNKNPNCDSLTTIIAISRQTGQGADRVWAAISENGSIELK